jgi:hypothetical protein
MMPCGLKVADELLRKHRKGCSSQYTCCSRTRRAISWVYLGTEVEDEDFLMGMAESGQKKAGDG